MDKEEAKDLAGKALSAALREGASYAEARAQYVWGRQFVLRNGEPQPAFFGEGYGLGVRVIADGALSFAAANEMSATNAKELGRQAVRMARASSSILDKPLGLDESPVSKARWRVGERRKVEVADTEWLRKVLAEIDGRIADGRAGVKIPGRVLVLGAELEERYLVTSDGAVIEGRVPRVRFNGVLTALDGGNSATRAIQEAETGGLEALERMRIGDRVEEEARTMGRVLREGGKPPTDVVDVVLSPELSGIAAHESVGHPQEADRILGREGAQAGESYLKADSLGRKVGSREANVSDDPTIPHSNGYAPFDDEGVKTRKRRLIRDGVINEFLQNRTTAKAFGLQSNGAARAVSFDREPIIRMSNTFVEPGDYSTEEILKEVKHGVYFKSYTEWNIDDKRLNQRYVALEAYLIERGETKGLLKAPVLEITTPRLWSSVKARSKNLEFDAGSCGKGDPYQVAPVWTGGPETLLTGIRLGAR